MYLAVVYMFLICGLAALLCAATEVLKNKVVVLYNFSLKKSLLSKFTLNLFFK